MRAATGGSGFALAERAPVPNAASVWADLAPRLGSALVLLPVVLGCVLLGGLPWLGLVGAGFVVLLMEWARLCRHGRFGPATRAVGILYAGLALASLILLRRAAGGLVLVGFLLLVVAATDIGAYLVGRMVGGRRLAPAISPGKTWSGAVGGLLAALLVATVFAARLSASQLAALPAHLAGLLLLAGLLSLVAQIGDLMESAVKRRCGVKDSGQLLPGHGGLLDRVDGILAAAPVLAAISFLLVWGNSAWIWQP